MPEIPKAYEPQSVEEKWYQYWLEQKCFVADPHSRKPAYSIVIPPPNVTGMLTLGHVLNNTIQDILARLAAGHRPRRHRHAGGSRTIVAQRRSDEAPRRIRPGKISEGGLGLEGKTR